MEEGQVSIDGESMPLPSPFFVVATQNPLEYEGTYPLPEAQLDRFSAKLIIDYPGEEEEALLLREHRLLADRESRLEKVVDVEDLLSLRKEVDEIIVEDRKSTRLNSSHVKISYAVFCLKNKILRR